MSQFKKGTIVSYLGIFITNITGLLLTPYIIKSLGDSDYGVYVLVGSVITYLVTLDFGLNNAVTRYVTKYSINNKKKDEENVLAHVGVTSLGLICLAALAGLYIFFNFEFYFKDSLTLHEIQLAKQLLPFLIFNVLVILPGTIFTAYAHAKQKFVYPKFVGLIKIVLRAILVFIALYFGFKALAIVIIDTVFNTLVTLLLLLFCVNKLDFKVKLHKWNANLWREILYYSFWIFLASVVLKLQWQSGNTIVGLQIDAIAVAIFGVGIMVGGYYNAFAFAINSMVLPRAVNLIESHKTGKAVTQDMVTIARYILFVLLLISTGFFLFGESFIILWLNETYIESYYLALMIMILRTIPLSQIYGNSILEAKAKNRFKSLLGLITILLASALAYYLAPVYGLKGVLWPIIIALALDNLIMNLYYRKIFEFQIGYFFKKTILSILIPVMILVLVFYIINAQIKVESWLDLALICGVYAIFYCYIIYYFVLNQQEKNTILKIIK